VVPTHPRAIELADASRRRAGDLDRVFFTTGGGEAVETAWKLAKQYWKLVGKPMKHKVISRSVAYHGTPQGALSITGIPAGEGDVRAARPGGFRVPNTNLYRAPEHLRDDRKAFGRWAADRIAEAIEFEGPTPSPRCSSSRCRTPVAASRRPPGYFQRGSGDLRRVRRLLVSDEVICASAGSARCSPLRRLRLRAGHHHLRQGDDPRYSPIGAMIAERPLFEPFRTGRTSFPHGYTFGGHPVSSAVRWPTSTSSSGRASPTTSRERPRLPGDPGEAARPADRRRRPGRGLLLRDRARQGQGHPGDVRRRRERAAAARLPLEGAVRRRPVLPGRRPRRPVVQLAPPLIVGQPEFDEIEQVLRSVLTEAVETPLTGWLPRSPVPGPRQRAGHRG
jgi:adenosylmethionine-8-amino-7-oxononanoate aminotransferase